MRMRLLGFPSWFGLLLGSPKNNRQGEKGKRFLSESEEKKSDNVIIILLRRTPACPASCERKPKSVEMVWPIWDILAAAVASLVLPCEDVLESS